MTPDALAQAVLQLPGDLFSDNNCQQFSDRVTARRENRAEVAERLAEVARRLQAPQGQQDGRSKEVPANSDARARLRDEEAPFPQAMPRIDVAPSAPATHGDVLAAHVDAFTAYAPAGGSGHTAFYQTCPHPDCVRDRAASKPTREADPQEPHR